MRPVAFGWPAVLRYHCMVMQGGAFSLAQRSVSVIGGGAAGFAAAICAARQGCDVTVFEASERVGNTIKVTGDGRCNIANSTTKADDYHNGEFVANAFGCVSPGDALRFLEGCGVILREEAQGRLYPQTNKSTSVIDALRQQAARFGVVERCSSRADRVSPRKGGWLIGFEDGRRHECDAVILACGGGRVPKSLLPQGISTVPRVPLLGPMKTDPQALKGLDKVRAKCSVSVGGRIEDGEVTFRSYGISGIAAFNMTRHADPGDVIRLDFLSFMDPDASLPMLEERLELLDPADWLELTCGMLLPLVARAVLRQAGIPAESKPRKKDLPRFDRAIRAFELEYLGVGDEKLCQVRRGGVDVSQVDPGSMQLIAHSGLYCVGEMLDVDGPCGGYNLHWAWVSGMIAGRAVADDQDR